MTKIKPCGLSRTCDIEEANLLRPDYIVTAEQAGELKKQLRPEIRAVGVFVNEAPEAVAALLNRGVIDLAQLHGSEDTEYIRRLRELTDGPLIQAFKIRAKEDLSRAAASTADEILLDAGAGTGTVFDWSLLRNMERRYYLAGGLNPENVREAIRDLHPYGVDVSSGIETDARKDRTKMAAFVAAVREEDRR